MSSLTYPSLFQCPWLTLSSTSMIDTKSCYYLRCTTLFCGSKSSSIIIDHCSSNHQIRLDSTKYRQLEKPLSGAIAGTRDQMASPSQEQYLRALERTPPTTKKPIRNVKAQEDVLSEAGKRYVAELPHILIPCPLSADNEV